MIILFIISAIIRILPHQQKTRGLVGLNIPILHVSKQLKIDRDSKAHEKKLSEKTTTILLSETGDFIFGELKAFGSEYHLQRNKFFVEQVNGQPQLGNLIKIMGHWYENKKGKKPERDELAILIPASQVPLAVITNIVAGLKQSTDIKQVILGNGLN